MSSWRPVGNLRMGCLSIPCRGECKCLRSIKPSLTLLKRCRYLVSNAAGPSYSTSGHGLLAYAYICRGLRYDCIRSTSLFGEAGGARMVSHPPGLFCTCLRSDNFHRTWNGVCVLVRVARKLLNEYDALQKACVSRVTSADEALVSDP